MCRACDDTIPGDQYVAIVQTTDGRLHLQPVDAWDRGDARTRADYRRNAGIFANCIRTHGLMTTCDGDPRAYAREDILGPVTAKLARDLVGFLEPVVPEPEPVRFRLPERRLTRQEAVQLMIPVDRLQ